jgi:predicted ATPase
MMTGFSHLKVSGFRRLCDVDFPLKSFNVLIGANGVGKTSVLEVMSLLASSASGRLDESVRAGGGIASLITSGRQDPLSIALTMPERQHAPLHYELSVSAAPLGFGIELEQLTQQLNAKPFRYIDSRMSDIRYYEVDSKKLVRPTWEHKPFETSLSQVPRMFRAAERFRETLSSLTLFHALDVSPRSPVRQPQPMQPAPLPGQDGEDLVSCLYYLRETTRERFEAIEDSLSAAFPTFERLDFPPVAAGQLSLAWKDRNYSKQLYAHQLSEGTLRFLWLITLLQSPALPTVTLIDEPEVSLHPEMLRLLAELMREAASRTQLIVATHSDRFVRFLEPSELVVCDLDETGGTVLRRADSLELDEWMKDYTLDQLWSIGRLGGRS